MQEKNILTLKVARLGPQFSTGRNTFENDYSVFLESIMNSYKKKRLIIIIIVSSSEIRKE